jgi:hypothetical protein
MEQQRRYRRPRHCCPFAALLRLNCRTSAGGHRMRDRSQPNVGPRFRDQHPTVLRGVAMLGSAGSMRTSARSGASPRLPGRLVSMPATIRCRPASGGLIHCVRSGLEDEVPRTGSPDAACAGRAVALVVQLDHPGGSESDRLLPSIARGRSGCGTGNHHAVRPRSGGRVLLSARGVGEPRGIVRAGHSPQGPNTGASAVSARRDRALSRRTCRSVPFPPSTGSVLIRCSTSTRPP